MPEKYSAETIQQKATRVIFEATKRNRMELVRRLTKPNAKALHELLEQEAQFHKSEPGETNILIADELQSTLPEAFFEHPSAWIEQQAVTPSTHGQPTEGRIKTIEHEGHNADLHRVKKITLKDGEREVPIISKRINPKWEDWHEAENIRKAEELGFPVPKIVGEILDQGNLYLWTEYIQSRPLSAAWDFFDRTNAKNIIKLLPRSERVAAGKKLADMNREIRAFEQRRTPLISLAGRHDYDLPQEDIYRLQTEQYATAYIDAMRRGLTPSTEDALQKIQVDPLAFSAGNLLRSIERRNMLFYKDENGKSVPYNKVHEKRKGVLENIAKILRERFPGRYIVNNAHLYQEWICLGPAPSYKALDEIRERFIPEDPTDRLTKAYEAVGLKKFASADHVLVRWNEKEGLPMLKSDGTIDYCFIDWEKEGFLD